MLKPPLLSIVIALFSCAATAVPTRFNDANTIYWQTYHRPPGIIKIGDDQGTGFVEEALNLVTQHMTEYTHEYPIASLTRALTDMKSHKQVCHPALYKTKERSQYMVFSKASLINPSNRVIALTGTLDHLANNNTVDLVQLLESQRYSFSLIKGRSYGQDVDDKMKNPLPKNQSLLLASTEIDAVFNMVAKQRVDFTIAFPFELNYFAEKNGFEKGTFSSYFIKDVPQYTLGYIACPNSQWGKKVIAKVDKVLSKVKLKSDYKQAVTSWWGDEQFSKAFEEFYQTTFLTH